jgi:hypothetical protein
MTPLKNRFGHGGIARRRPRATALALAKYGAKLLVHYGARSREAATSIEAV